MPLIAVFVSLIILLFMSLTILLFVSFAVSRLVLRHIDIVVPPITHEIDRLAASVIFAAVLFPFFFMSRRYVQVDWRGNTTNSSPPNHDGPCVNEFWLRIVSDVNATIKARLADADRHADICCLG